MPVEKEIIRHVDVLKEVEVVREVPVDREVIKYIETTGAKP